MGNVFGPAACIALVAALACTGCDKKLPEFGRDRKSVV